ncbi:MAG: serine hydrolase domain-containing protein [Planctomycetota bacterium]|jgi:CubicO group peptidase (beta-lactamase class C family)
MLLLVVSTLLCAQIAPSDELQPQVLSAKTLQSASQVGVHLPVTIPGNWRSLQVPAAVPPPAALMAPWPTDDWTTSTPAAENMDPQWIAQAFQYGFNQGSQAMVVIRNGYIVAEWYASDWSVDARMDGFSLAKSVSSAAFGSALQDGLFPSIDEPAATYISDWDMPSHDDVTLRHLLSMDSGLHWDFFSDYILIALQQDQSQFAVDLGVDAPPATEWVYNNTACQSLAEVFLRRTGHQLAEYSQRRIASVIGMDEAGWMTDQVGNTLSYRSVYASAREFAKFGYLYLRDGEWDGQQVLPASWVADSTSPSQSLNPFYGYLWWLNTGSLDMPDVPADAFYGAGAFEKRIYVVPSKDLVVIRLGPGSLSWDDNAYLGPICTAAQ